MAPVVATSHGLAACDECVRYLLQTTAYDLPADASSLLPCLQPEIQKRESGPHRHRRGRFLRT